MLFVNEYCQLIIVEYNVYKSCVSACMRAVYSFNFFHNFTKGAEREEEFSDNSVEDAGSEEERHTTPPYD